MHKTKIEMNFNVMITDFHMPGKDGIQVAKECKESQINILTIMVTAGLKPKVVEAAANAGISQILAKPVNIKQLMASIELALCSVCSDAPNPGDKNARQH